MYLVSTNTFKEYITKNHLVNNYIPKPENLPCIIEFSVKNILKAKVEVLNYTEFISVVKFKKILQTPKNKYWIRGAEWKKDDKGNIVEKLQI